MRISKVLLCRQDCCNWKFGIVVAFDPFWVGPRSNQFKVILKLRFSKLGGFKLSPNGNTPATICVGGDTLRICWIATRNWTPWTHPTPQITRDQGLTLEVEKKTTHGCTLLPTSRYSCDISLYEAIRSEVFLQEDGAGGMSWNTSGNGTWPQGKQEKRFALKCVFVLVFIICSLKVISGSFEFTQSVHVCTLDMLLVFFDLFGIFWTSCFVITCCWTPPLPWVVREQRCSQRWGSRAANVASQWGPSNCRRKAYQETQRNTIWGRIRAGFLWLWYL